jgi:hypothetical protein
VRKRRERESSKTGELNRHDAKVAKGGERGREGSKIGNEGSDETLPNIDEGS